MACETGRSRSTRARRGSRRRRVRAAATPVTALALLALLTTMQMLLAVLVATPQKARANYEAVLKERDARIAEFEGVSAALMPR